MRRRTASYRIRKQPVRGLGDIANILWSNRISWLELKIF